jgi:MarR family transcriptional regulator for hemolysin
MDRIRNLGFLFKDIGRLYTKLFEERASHLEANLAQCKALIYISKNQGISQIRLAELSGIEPMSLVRMLDRMEADGWIERRAHPADRRARQLYLKEKAQPTLEQIWKIGDEVRAQTLAGFKADERNLLLDLLERAQANLLEAKVEETATAKGQAKDVSAASKTAAKNRRRSAVLKSASLRVKTISSKLRKPLRSVR